MTTTITLRAETFHAMRRVVLAAREQCLYGEDGWRRINKLECEDAWVRLALDPPVDDVAALEDAIAFAPQRVYQGRLRRVFEMIGVTGLASARTVEDTELLSIRNFGESSLAVWRAALRAYDVDRETRGA